MSGETLLTLTFLSLRLSMVLKVENLSKETQTYDLSTDEFLVYIFSTKL